MSAKSKAIVYLLSPRVIMIVLTLVGFAARLYRLDARGFWFDEFTNVQPVRLATFGEVISYVQSWKTQAPLTFLMSWVLRGFGGDEFHMRLSYALVGTLSVPAIYALGRYLANRRVGLIVALLLALSPFAVYYSQQVRQYSPDILFTILQILFAYRCIVYARWYDWAGLCVVTVLFLYTGYMALLVAGICAVFLGLSLVGEVRALLPANKGATQAFDKSQRAASGRRFVYRLVGVISVSVFSFLAYLPWLPTLQTFVDNTNGLVAFQARSGLLAQVQALGYNLGLSAWLLPFLLLGLFYTVARLIRGRHPTSILLLVWGLLPLAVWWLKWGSATLTFVPRYFSFLIPLLLLFVGLGVDCLVLFVGRWSSVRLMGGVEGTLSSESGGLIDGIFTTGSGRATRLVSIEYGVALLFLLGQVTPTLAESYDWKPDLPSVGKEVTDYIIPRSAPGSLLLQVGNWGIRSAPVRDNDLNYYMWLDQPPIKLVDATLLDSFTATHLNPDATVWVITGLLKPADMERAKEMDLEVVALDGATVLRQADPRQAPAAQLDLLLTWSENPTIHEGIMATRTLLNEDFAASKLGENMLPPLTETWTPVGGYGPFDSNVIPDRWTLWPRTSDGNGSGVFTLDGGAEVNKPSELNVTLTTHRLVPGKSYVLLFQYHNTALTGTQRVYVSMHGDDGSWLDIYPRGEGYLCAAGTDSGGALALLVPANTTKSVIWLRIDGTGSAQYSSVELREILH